MADSNPATTMQRISKDANWNPGLCGTTWHNFLYWLTQHVQMVSQPRNSSAGHLRHSLLLSQPNSSIASPFLSTMRFAACMSCIHRDLVKSSCGHFNSNQTRRQILHSQHNYRKKQDIHSRIEYIDHIWLSSTAMPWTLLWGSNNNLQQHPAT